MIFSCTKYHISVVLNPFTLLCNFHHYPSPELFPFLDWNCVPIKKLTPHSPPCFQPLASTSVLSDDMNLTILGTLWNQIHFSCLDIQSSSSSVLNLYFSLFDPFDTRKVLYFSLWLHGFLSDVLLFYSTDSDSHSPSSLTSNPAISSKQI